MGEIATLNWVMPFGSTAPPPVINGALPDFDAVGSGGSGTWAQGTYTQAFDGDVDIDLQKSIAGVIHTFLQAIKGYQVAAFAWTEIRVAALNSDGSYVNGATVFTYTTPVAGTITGAFPPHNAVAITHRTAGRGPRNRGRLYVPFHGPAAAMSSASLGPTAATQTALNAAENALMDSLSLLSVTAAVTSMTHGTFSTLLATAVGDEFDVVRRRRAQRKEEYQVLAWP